MGLKQKYIEEIEHTNECRFDEWFIDEIMEYPYTIGIQVMAQLERNAPLLPSRVAWSQFVAGVVKGEKPFFFEVEYVKEKDHHPIYVDINPIDCDEYLDYINQNRKLK